MQAKVFVTRKVPDAGLDLLQKAGHSVTVSEKDGVLSQTELQEALDKNEYDAILTTLSDHISGEVLDSTPSVRIVANYAVGFDNIDTQAAKARDVVVTNTPGVLTNAVAEHTMSLLFALAKRVPEADRFTRAGSFTGWGPMLLLGIELHGKTLGLVGLGRIGSRVAEIASCMGIRVLYFDISRNEEIEKRFGVSYVSSIEEIFTQSDFVSLHVPLLDSTRHLVKKEHFVMMKPTSFLVNTARGAIVDEQALVQALKNRTIRGAALDVFEHEPELSSGLVDLENVILTPHIGSATEKTRTAMSVLAAESIIDFFKGKDPKNKVV